MSRASLMRFSMALMATVLINALLFAGLPLLTRVTDREKPDSFESPIMIAHIKPLKPPEEQKQRELKERKLKQMNKKNTKTSQSKPKIEASKFDFATDMGGSGIGMQVGGMGKMQSFKSEMQNIEFELTEVDTPPRVTRKAPPVYPFGAKRKGITGYVMIRCLIGIDGKPAKLKIIKSKPEGVFDDAGLAAVQKWRFKPGILGGEAVPTWVRIPFKFSLD
ncbi:MAG: energy transducer TonB [Thermodesulfobacteriota bacterium]